jgi:dipeptidyl aminopeptidase/acylaminoacyl peptidase
MTRNRLAIVVLASFLSAPAGSAAPRVERGDLIFDNIPDAPAGHDVLDRYLAAREAAPLSWSPQGQLLIATRFGEVEQLHLVDAPGGERRQLTFTHEPITEAAFSPAPGRNVYWYVQDAAGNEATQIYYQRLGEPTAKLLTDGKSWNGAALWSNDGRQIAFSSTARTGADTDIDVVDPETGTLPHLVVTGDDAAWTTLDWSPDDGKLLVQKTVSPSESYLYVVDLATGQKRAVEPGTVRERISGAKFSRDGQGVYLISDRDGEFAKIFFVNLFTAAKAVVAAAVPGGVEQLALSRDGHYLAFVSNEAGGSKLNLQDLSARQDLTPPSLPPGLIADLHFDAQGKRLAFSFTAVTQPRDAYVLDIAANHLEAWTHSEAGAVDAAKFVTPRLTEFPTFDREDGHLRQEPAYVYEPLRPGPHPVLLWLHDGPDGEFRPSFDPWLGYVVNELGFAVVAPNIRGSSGYGKSYSRLANGDSRDDVVKDLGALIVWIDAQSSFDPKHVVVAGRGYGGYLALTALANYGDRLRGGVDIAGISDLIPFLEAAPAFRQARQRAQYGNERDSDMRSYLRRISPLTDADRMSQPLLVVQGRNDAEVPAAQSELIVNRLRSRNIDVEYLEAKDEGHTWRRHSNREAYYRVFSDWLVQALRAEPTGSGRLRP